MTTTHTSAGIVERAGVLFVGAGTTPTASPATSTQGDVDCNGNVTSIDTLKELRFVAQLSVSQTEPCPGIGMPEGG